MKASEKLKNFRKKYQTDIGRARITAQTEVKFREWFETVDAPEFKILPEHLSIYGVEKAKEKIEEIQNLHCGGVSHNVVHFADYATVKDKSIVSTCNGSMTMGTTLGGTFGGAAHPEECSCCVQDNHKQNLRTHAGKLSNNMKKSHLMMQIQKEHDAKVKQLERIRLRKQRYMQSPTRSRQRSTEESFNTNSYLRLNESMRSNTCGPLSHRQHEIS